MFPDHKGNSHYSKKCYSHQLYTKKPDDTLCSFAQRKGRFFSSRLKFRDKVEIVEYPGRILDGYLKETFEEFDNVSVEDKQETLEYIDREKFQFFIEKM